MTLLETTIGKFVAKTQPEKIICYGVRTDSNARWSCFVRDQKEETAIELDLLVITLKTDKRDREHIANTIVGFNNDPIRFVTVVHSLKAVCEKLKEGNSFFATVCLKGILLYDRSHIPLDTISPELKQLTYSSRKLATAESFYQTARECANNQRYEAAMLMAHQSTELCCCELLLCCIGYRPNTHSIQKLFDLVDNFTDDVRRIFPVDNKYEAELIRKLFDAYIDARYQDDYNIASNDALAIIERVGKLNTLTANFCKSQSDHSS